MYLLFSVIPKPNPNPSPSPNPNSAQVYLFFSVNASGQFSGMAQMESALDYTNKFGCWAQDKCRSTLQAPAWWRHTSPTRASWGRLSGRLGCATHSGRAAQAAQTVRP